MNKFLITDIVTPALERGAIYNDEFEGFHNDYLVIHALLRAHKPLTFMEVGTNCGTGTNIICNALRQALGHDAKVYSLDLPYEQHHLSKQQPMSEGKGMAVGKNCKFPYTQLWGDSREYDFKQHGDIEGWFIDGDHVYNNVVTESNAALAANAKLMLWHDRDISEVWEAIWHVMSARTDYHLSVVEGTRIAFAVKK